MSFDITDGARGVQSDFKSLCELFWRGQIGAHSPIVAQLGLLDHAWLHCDQDLAPVHHSIARLRTSFFLICRLLRLKRLDHPIVDLVATTEDSYPLLRGLLLQSHEMLLLHTQLRVLLHLVQRIRRHFIY